MTKGNHRQNSGNILVIGGGIAGMAAALSLRKAGLAPAVFEAHGRTSDGVGAFLTLAVNGIEALSAIDVAPQDLGGFDTPSIELFLGDGRRLTSLEFGASRPGCPVARTIRRADLYGSLRREAERRGIPVQYGKRLVSAESVGGKVTARFSDGSSAEGDILVAADGLRSRVRKILDPRAPNARYVGLLNAGGYARGVRVDGDVGTMRMFFGKRCFFGYVLAPDGDVWWFANPSRKTEPTEAELGAITEDAWRAELLDLFAVDASPACSVIEATDRIFTGWPTYDFPTVPVWHRDRMILIGDSAHAASPASGQGASMAIEDAVILAKALRDESDVEEAFRCYEHARRRRVERVVAQGKRSGDGKTPGPFGRVVRDAALRLIFSRKQTQNPWAFLDEHPVRWTGPVADSQTFGSTHHG